MNPASMHESSITRYLDAALLLLIATGFGTLAGTGKLDGPSVVAVSAALLGRGYLLLRRREFILPEPWISYLTIAYTLFYVVDLTLVSGGFIPATVHLLLFSMVVKIFSVNRDRDRLYLGILSLLAVLAAAVLTVDSIFLAAFCLYLLLAIAGFVAFEMKRAAERGQIARPPQPCKPGLAFSLSGTVLALLLIIVLGATVIFFVTPRVSTGYLSAYAPRNDLVSGFSDRVRLGQIGEIKLSDTVVMHVQIEGDTSGAFDLKWRGVALDTFDGERWTNSQSASRAPMSSEGTFQVRMLPPPAYGARLRFIRYRVLMEPIGTNVFFLAPTAYSLSGNYRSVTVDAGGSVFDSDHDGVIGAYRALSDIQQVGADAARASGGQLPPGVAIPYLQLPGVSLRLRKLALQATASAPTAYDKAVALERYLHTNYGYSLRMSRTPPHDALDYFLFERKQGHCEYFASAMAIMLRTLGIPARVVNGFRSGEFNPLTGSYIVRARDAHSWVEAYFPGAGWASFDPTPPDPRPPTSAWSRSLLYLDAMRQFWREWIINYDFAHQTTLAVGATERSRRTFADVSRWWRSQYGGLLRAARRVHMQAAASPGRAIGGALGIIFALAVLGNVGTLRRWWWKRMLARNPQKAPQAAASLWYARMTRSLARQGYRKSPAQTPTEFLEVIERESLRRSVAAFTEHYERARFGDSAEDARELPKIYEQIQKL